jgi:hypothetical protein
MFALFEAINILLLRSKLFLGSLRGDDEDDCVA